MMLPQLDFSTYTNGTTQQRDTFCRELREALHRWGFVSLINYGISAEELESLFEHSRRFFSLTHEEKMSAPHPATPNPHRGYSFVGQEVTSSLSREREKLARSSRRLKDLKETFDWGSSGDRLYPNVWPNCHMASGFRATLERHFDCAHRLHLQVLEAIAQSLGAPSRAFLDAHGINESEARLAHYPSVDTTGLGVECGTSRICEHTDSGSVTLLWQDSVGGLEIEDHVSHRFVAVEAPTPAVLVNLGDAMERWSNGRLHAAYHRVGKPAGFDGEHIPGRFSVIYFGKPARHASLAPLPEFVSAESPAVFPVTTGHELNQATLLQTYMSENDALSMR